MRSKLSVFGLGAGVLLAGMLATAASAQTPPGASRSAGTELSAPARLPSRARTRIRVMPSYYPYRTFSTDYPVPYPIEYPGPGFVRQCTSWLATENRVSGAVIVPRQRCWWQRG